MIILFLSSVLSLVESIPVLWPPNTPEISKLPPPNTFQPKYAIQFYPSDPVISDQQGLSTSPPNPYSNAHDISLPPLQSESISAPLSFPKLVLDEFHYSNPSTNAPYSDQSYVPEHYYPTKAIRFPIHGVTLNGLSDAADFTSSSPTASTEYDIAAPTANTEYIHDSQAAPTATTEYTTDSPVSTQLTQGIQIFHLGDYGLHRNPKNLETLFYGRIPKCRTVYENKEDPFTPNNCDFNKTSCSTVCACENSCSDCTEESAPQCYTLPTKKCIKKYETTYREECELSHESLCTTITVTKYVDECKTEFRSECDPEAPEYAGIPGYPCVQVPHKVCDSVPVTKQVEKCTSVPTPACRRTPVRTPRRVCVTAARRKCASGTLGCSPSECDSWKRCIEQCNQCQRFAETVCKTRTRTSIVKVPIKICDD